MLSVHHTTSVFHTSVSIYSFVIRRYPIKTLAFFTHPENCLARQNFFSLLCVRSIISGGTNKTYEDEYLRQPVTRLVNYDTA